MPSSFELDCLKADYSAATSEDATPVDRSDAEERIVSAFPSMVSEIEGLKRRLATVAQILEPQTRVMNPQLLAIRQAYEIAKR